MDKHSKYSPSGFGVWSVCPMAATMKDKYPSPGNRYSDRGTALHKACEDAMGEYLLTGAESFPAIEATLPREDVTDFRTAIGYAIAMIAASPDVRVYTEQRVTGAAIKIPVSYDSVFGTVDLLVVDKTRRLLSVYDYKFGHRVHEHFINQLKIYAMLALYTKDVEDTNGIVDICLCVIQPATAQVPKKVVISIDELLQWWKDEFQPAYFRASADSPEAVPSEDGCRYCPGVTKGCPAFNQQMNDLFDIVEEKTVIERPLGEILRLLDLAAAYRKVVADEILTKLQDGVPVPGFKLVRTNKNRAWAEEEKADRWMAVRGLGKKDRYTYRLISPAQAEKKLKVVLSESDRAKRAFSRLITRPEGDLTFAKETDPRPEVVVNAPRTEELFDDNFEI